MFSIKNAALAALAATLDREDTAFLFPNRISEAQQRGIPSPETVREKENANTARQTLRESRDLEKARDIARSFVSKELHDIMLGLFDDGKLHSDKPCSVLLWDRLASYQTADAKRDYCSLSGEQRFMAADATRLSILENAINSAIEPHGWEATISGSRTKAYKGRRTGTPMPAEGHILMELRPKSSAQ